MVMPDAVGTPFQIRGRVIISLRSPSMRRAFAVHARLFVISYSGAIALCGLMAAIPYYAWGETALYFYTDVYGLRSIGGWDGSGAMTLVSGALLAGGGALVLVAAGRELLRDVRTGLLWCFAGLCGILLAFDEVFMWHESWTATAASLGVPKLLGIVDQDVYVFCGYGVFALLTLVALKDDLPRHKSALFPAIVAVAFFLASQILDFVPWHSLSQTQKGILGPAEEIAKTLGSFSWFLFALLRSGPSLGFSARPAVPSAEVSSPFGV